MADAAKARDALSCYGAGHLLTPNSCSMGGMTPAALLAGHRYRSRSLTLCRMARIERSRIRRPSTASGSSMIARRAAKNWGWCRRGARCGPLAPRGTDAPGTMAAERVCAGPRPARTPFRPVGDGRRVPASHGPCPSHTAHVTLYTGHTATRRAVRMTMTYLFDMPPGARTPAAGLHQGQTGLLDRRVLARPDRLPPNLQSCEKLLLADPSNAL